MNLKNFTFLALITLSSNLLFAQENNTPRCGVGLEDGEIIKNRMLENRRTVTPERIQAFQNTRAVKYIPVQFTIVGDNNATGYVDIDNVFAMLCDMNNDYRSQDIQFYMKNSNNSVRYSNNTTVYNDGAGNSSQIWMFNNKVSSSLNIYLSASINNQVASYYTGAGDFVFVLNQMANGTSSTGSHEVGHFFSLPHTFYGWEGTTFSGGAAPNSVGGRAVEKVARTGSGANCASAADGFCDTPSDYFSDRVPCPYGGNGTDATGAQINPEESLIMSYFYDQCVDSFSNEQKGAVAADVLRRGWSNFPAPNPMAAVSGTTTSALAPVTGSTFPLNGDVTLTWDAVPNATGYVILVERTLLGTPISTITKKIVYGSTSTTLPVSLLAYPRQYSWKVKPFNQYNTCGVYSAPFTFTTTAPASSVEESFKTSAELKILSNPISSFSADVLINVPFATTASMSLYSMDGKQLINLKGVELNAGDNLEIIDVSSFTNGVYLLTVNTPQGTLQQKLVIQK